MSIHQIIRSNSATKVLQEPYFNKEIVESKVLGAELGTVVQTYNHNCYGGVGRGTSIQWDPAENQKQKTEKASSLKLVSHGHTLYTPEPKSPQNRVQWTMEPGLVRYCLYSSKIILILCLIKLINVCQHKVALRAFLKICFTIFGKTVIFLYMYLHLVS